MVESWAGEAGQVVDDWVGQVGGLAAGLGEKGVRGAVGYLGKGIGVAVVATGQE